MYDLKTNNTDNPIGIEIGSAPSIGADYFHQTIYVGT